MANRDLITTPAVRRRRPTSAQVGTVSRTPKLTPATQDIVADVLEVSRQQGAEISRRLQELVVIGTARHQRRAEELVSIGVQMDRPMLDDFFEIGHRMLAARGNRGCK